MVYQEGMEKVHGNKSLAKDVLREEDLQCWIISDTHFFHDNIIHYAGRPRDHDQLMRDNWQSVVGVDEPILHLGDLAFGPEERLTELKDLPGQKTLLLGNHDRRNPRRYLDIGFRVIKRGFSVPWKGWTVHFVHDPSEAPPLYPKQLVLHGHIHEKNYTDPRYVNLSVEQTAYRPLWLPDVLEERIGELKTANGNF